MPVSKLTQHGIKAVVLLGVGLMPIAPARGASPATGPVSDRKVAAKALHIVSEIRGSWSQMPGNIARRTMTPGALIGNGSVGVAIGGTADQQEFYVGRNDFWSVLSGDIKPFGRLQLLIPNLQGAASQIQENIGPANVTGSFAQGTYGLRSQSWVATDSNAFFVELQNSGQTALPVTAQLLDLFGEQDRETLGGVTGEVDWLRVSPEIVRAAIGGPAPQSTGPSNTNVQSVRIFDRVVMEADSPEKPLYSWFPRSRPDAATGAGNGGSSQVFSCGDIIMPQRRFTVEASIRIDHSGDGGSIFSAQTRHRWMKQLQDPADPLGNVRGHDVPRTQGPEAGLIVYLSQGRVAANLNGTVVAADRPVPPEQWVRVAVIYDGSKMSLLMDGVVVGETRNFPTAAEVMGPKWQWAASHPGDPQIPFGGSAPEGVLAARVIGASASADKGGLHFVIPAGGRAILAVAAMDDRDTAAYFHMGITTLQHADAKTVGITWSRHVSWWNEFWSRSFVEIPDKTLQSWWYGSLYVLASCSRTGNVAPGLWGNWITYPEMAWQGDYTLDYNYQAPFWAAFPTNHVSLADSYDAPLLAWIQRGRGLARKLNAQGLLYYAHLAPSPVWSADNFRALDQKSDALFAAINCVQRWRYTRDATYARKMWPFLTGVADFWDHDLKRVNGAYGDFDDAADEHLWGPADDVNPATTIGFLHMLYPALIEMSKQLNTAQEMRPIWQNILAHLGSLPIAPANSVEEIRKAVASREPIEGNVILQAEHGMQWVSLRGGDRFSSNPPVRVTGSSAGMNSLQAVFPAWNVGVESSPALRQAAVNTVNYMRLWYDSNDTSSFYPAAADAGFAPESILEHMHLLVTHIGYPNFAFNIGAGGVENEATVPTTISAMLLQSYQKSIHVFANWPKDQDASFGDLLAVGDFLVSSEKYQGKVKYVRITSSRGGICNLANPWGDSQSVKVQIAGERDRVFRGHILTVPMRAGETVTFAPTEIRAPAQRPAS